MLNYFRECVVMWYWKWQRFRVGIRGISHNNLRALLMLESLTSNNHLWALHCWMPTPLALTIVLDVADVQIRFSHNYLGALKVFYNVLYLGAFQVLESGFSHNYLRALPVLESGISQNRLGTLQELDFDISHFYLGTLQVLECEKLCEIAILLSYNFARY